MYIGCKEKVIFISADEATPDDVITILLGGSVSMINLLFKREKSTLLVITKESRNGVDVTQFPIVCDFPGVFPKDITYLPLEGEVEFSIDLVSGTALISFAPYRMSPVELRELKNKLEDLLDKDFVRSSVSPWGASMFLVKKKYDRMRSCVDYR